MNGNVVQGVSPSTYDGYIESAFGDPVHMFPQDTADTTTIARPPTAFYRERPRKCCFLVGG